MSPFVEQGLPTARLRWALNVLQAFSAPSDWLSNWSFLAPTVDVQTQFLLRRQIELLLSAGSNR